MSIGYCSRWHFLTVCPREAKVTQRDIDSMDKYAREFGGNPYVPAKNEILLD